MDERTCRTLSEPVGLLNMFWSRGCCSHLPPYLQTRSPAVVFPSSAEFFRELQPQPWLQAVRLALVALLSLPPWILSVSVTLWESNFDLCMPSSKPGAQNPVPSPRLPSGFTPCLFFRDICFLSPANIFNFSFYIVFIVSWESREGSPSMSLPYISLPYLITILVEKVKMLVSQSCQIL